jgi:hypothetical protein
MTWIGAPAENQRGQRFYEPFNGTPTHPIVTSGIVSFGRGYIRIGPTVSDYATIPVGSDVVPSLTQNCTYIVRIRNLQPSAGDSALVSFGDAAGNSPVYFGTQGGNVGGGAGVLFSANSGVAPVAGATYHLVITYNGTTYEMFIDGVSVGSGSAALDLGTNPIIWLGGLGGTSSPCGGDVLSIRMFREVLTDQEILDFYNQETYSFLAEAAGSWPMLASTHDPGNSRTLDVSGNAYHATFSPTPPTKIATRHGYTFNGSSNYLDVADATGIIPNGDVSNVTLFVAFVRGPGGGFMWWFQRGQGGSRANMSLFTLNTTTIGYSGGTGGADIYYTTGNIAGQFHTLGYTYEKGSQVLYYDGKVVGQNTDITAYNITNPALRIGGQTTGGGFMDGEILSESVIGRTLSPIQVQTLHLNALSTYNQE